MTHPRHAEVAGAGLGGLAIATALAQHGWTVRVHERSNELRMFGAGIWMWENGLSSLRELGAEERTIRNARPIRAWSVQDEHGNEVMRRKITKDDRLLIPLRGDLYEALIEAAEKAGVEIVTSSTVASAFADGRLVLESGEELAADLVVGSDGAHSRIRESLDLTDRLEYLPEGYVRLLVPVQAGDPEDVVYEMWSGGRRLLLCPASDEMHYTGTTCPVDDVDGRRIPPDKATWAATFPKFEWLIDRFPSTARWDRGLTVRCRAWSAGSVVLIGDAAHAQAPNLAQGANLTFTNAVSLAAAVSLAPSVPAALRQWEQRERPLTDHTQRWSHAYGRIVSAWPEALMPYRAKVLDALTSIPWVEAQMNRAARHVRAPGPDAR
jgi:2-polyprenyl-6-methoxyphenol hydroxylase-like FAD-dependent oxidoreductase